ncbi:glycosyltransferase family 39 protein [Streptomyces sp. NRRL F-5630]|uniref:glycosyltransferase family 39 protein n=1 Tax=Streptomyces sp. NRRL F-5630 TaxID=1463864 RepID=UPI003D72B27E
MAVSFVLRLPAVRQPYWNPDEGYLATEAVSLAHGGRLYIDVVDRKPPLVPWLYEVCFAVSRHHSLWLVRLCAVLAIALAALYTAHLAANLFGLPAALPTGLLTIALTAVLPGPDTLAANFEVFMLPATAAAMYYGGRQRFFVAGLSVGLATLCKQVGLAPLLPLLLSGLSQPTRRWRHTGSLVAGVLLPCALAALITSPRAFLFWNFFASGHYAALPPLVTMMRRAFMGLLPLLVALGPLAVLAWSVRRPPETPPRWPRAAACRVGAWALSSACGVAAGFHFYGHYFLQLAPPLALTAGLAFHHVSGGRTRVRRAPPRPFGPLRPLGGAARWLGLRPRYALGVACALLIALGTTAVSLGQAPPAKDRTLAQVAAVEAHSTRNERLFVWGMHPEVYWLSGRSPASPYLTSGILTNFAGGGASDRVGAHYAVPGTWHLLSAGLRTRPPCLLLDDSAGTPYSLARYPLLAREVRRHYRPVAEAGGAVLYRRFRCAQPRR